MSQRARFPSMTLGFNTHRLGRLDWIMCTQHHDRAALKIVRIRISCKRGTYPLCESDCVLIAVACSGVSNEVSGGHSSTIERTIRGSVVVEACEVCKQTANGLLWSSVGRLRDDRGLFAVHSCRPTSRLFSRMTLIRKVPNLSFPIGDTSLQYTVTGETIELGCQHNE